jgi:hypothetical protein
MASVPGYCPHCGHIFDGRGGIHIEGGSNITFIGNSVTCPNCGRMANLVDGTFNERGHGLELVSGPPLTRAILEQLQEIARKARTSEITPEAALKQIEAIDPSLGGLLRRVPYVQLLSVMLSLIALYIAFEGNRSSSEFQNEAINLLRRQTDAVEIIAGRSIQERDSGGETGRDRNAEAETLKKRMALKSPSKRRAEVNKERRDALKRRRLAFPRRYRPPQS